MPAHPHLRLVRNDDNGGEGENERGQQQKQPEPERSGTAQVDPRLVAFLDKNTVSSAALRAGIFQPDDTVVLKETTRGLEFTHSQIAVLERWVVIYDPYQGKGMGVRDRLGALDRFVDCELAKYEGAAWLTGAVRQFSEYVIQQRRKKGANIALPLVRAVFVVLLTIKAS